MISEIFQYIEIIEDIAWGYIGFPLIVFLGIYLSLQSKWVQLRRLPDICRHFFRCILSDQKEGDLESSQLAVSPLRAFFASIGGCLGIGNVVAITTAVQIGGPGAILWIWATAILGALLKYSEVFLGMKTREMTPHGLRGGPMYFLQKGSSWKIFSVLFCVFMSLYGVEIYQFSVVIDVGSSCLNINRSLLTVLLIGMVIYAERGGTKRIGAISSFLIPIFLTIYLIMGFYVLASHITLLPGMLVDIVKSAFSARAAQGAFTGSVLLATISQGVRRGCYSSDVGVGYASIIHSQSSEKVPQKQASLLIFEVFMDTFLVCTMSVMLVLLTGVWKEAIPPSQLVQSALATCFPYTEYFMPFFLFLLGYTTIITYFSAGMNTMSYIMPKHGRTIYYIYAILAFTLFSFFETQQAISVMSCVQFFLLLLNSFGIWKFRKEISFDMDPIIENRLSKEYSINAEQK
ncbi:MAG: amino acid carrier protein [Chlamydia sp.]